MGIVVRVALVILLLLSGIGLYRYGRALWVPAWHKLAGKRTVEDVVTTLGPQAESRLHAHFNNAGITYPPEAVALLGLKAEKQLELWAGNGQRWTHVTTYPILGASGGVGPKLREGDRQVPEGVYRIEVLNPNSRYHLSMKVSYPNEFDRDKAALEGRSQLGGDIFIHGKQASIGCLAMGDPVIEELFLLVHRIGLDRVDLILAPHDLRRLPPLDTPEPEWLPELYGILQDRLQVFSH